ncbi:hypothetical protein Athai_16860 [Actinocatenispora thailandica]|uniref:PKD domain containing protein n=1 Tax=Actinocatenispora thailandica TaxID=227318 RepID=A0A7R7DM68_9ACTN|nr:hypothetical protein [Actinocatenispora thailandica]BCJ34183.1 hypothetical protein Athai_16860 [Actinocatenispora thailandica]
MPTTDLLLRDRLLAVLTCLCVVGAAIAGASPARAASQGGAPDPAVSPAAGTAAVGRAGATATPGRVVSDDPAGWTPDVLDGAVYQVIQLGGLMYAAGSFSREREAGSQRVRRVGSLFAFDARTGAIDTRFRPQLDGPVTAVVAAPDGRSLYVGGSFRSGGSARAPYLARVDASTGAAWPGFRPAALDRAVDRLVLVGDRLIAGGSFQTVDQRARPALASFDPATGRATADVDLHLTEPRHTSSGASAPIKVTALAATPDRQKLIFGGNFDRVAGATRYQLAVADLGTGAARLDPWSTTRYQPECSDHFPTYVRGIAVAPGGGWFVVTATGGGRAGKLCDAVARFDLTGGGSPAWVNWTGGDTLLSAAITDAAVYVGGHQRWMNNPQGNNSAGPGAVSRPGIAAVSPTNGRALPWNPGKDRGVGVFCILATDAGLWITSDTTHVHGEYHARIAFFPA